MIGEACKMKETRSQTTLGIQSDDRRAYQVSIKDILYMLAVIATVTGFIIYHHNKSKFLQETSLDLIFFKMMVENKYS